MKIEIESKFNVGDIVYLKQEVARYRTAEEKKYGLRSANPLIIVEITTQTCYAATQVIYRIRMYNDKGSMYENFNEIELTQELGE